MAIQSNNAEGGINGVTPEATDTGSGDSFGTVSHPATDSVFQYTNVSVGHGGMAYRAANRTALETATGDQTFTGGTSAFGREAIMVDNLSTTTRLVMFKSSASGTILGSLYLTGSSVGTLQIRNGAAVNVYSFTNRLTLGTWYRTEWNVVVNNTSTAFIQARLYNLDSNSLIEDSGVQTSPTNGAGIVPAWGTVRRGAFALANTPSTTGYYYFDDIVAGATDWPGPVGTTIVPVADVSAGTWTPSTGSTIYAMLDEAIPSDTDYAYSSTSPAAADETKVRMGPATDPAIGTGHTISYRYQKDVTAGDQIDLTVNLYAANAATVIQTWTHTNIGTVVTATQTLGTAAADSIPAADYATGLVLGFSAIKV